MILKTSSRMRQRKGPYRSSAHLLRVREQPCLACGRMGVQAHHLRVGLRTMGVRKADDRAVPLCYPCHTELHSSKEEWFWAALGVDPVAWCISFGGKP